LLEGLTAFGACGGRYLPVTTFLPKGSLDIVLAPRWEFCHYYRFGIIILDEGVFQPLESQERQVVTQLGSDVYAGLVELVAWASLTKVARERIVEGRPLSLRQDVDGTLR
jgi:hypothetical protein